ncbi:MAG: acetate--CoA ligase [Bacteroidetes bacterium]|nr:MAG: acetate--CoA ligase [Bacteroidota bacterium]REK04873.1 MAG: acetate--CoA ligase [Bacteroidota bacterium]REK36345.1 MAG: acetate--CoA ligase [Bacteroidota bacterium]REK50989.1 MAG: acetate--CoA ligase [Bacteroidota bacterium]
MAFRISSFEQYSQEYKQSVEQPEEFWSEKAMYFRWNRKWDKVLDWNFSEPDVKWFVNGKLNITENCLDRHLDKRGEQTAIIWEPNDPAKDAVRVITYAELYKMVCRFANVLLNNGVKKGDRICIYMPMVPEATVAMLACARVGAIHSVVFAGFSATSVSDRILDSNCTMVLTSDGAYRGAKEIEIKETVDEALEKCPGVERVIVLKRTGRKVNMKKGRDVYWHDEMEKAAEENIAEVMDSEDPLFILYTSGSTGKPKGVVHSCGGYMVYTAYSFQNVFQYNEGDIYWCTADIGWITGHSYIVYGPLLSGASTMIFEGIPTWPDAGKFWQVIDKHKVNIFYTAPTAIRALEAQGLDFVKPYKLDSLRVLGTVGEPINEEAWQWYSDYIGKKKCPIVDTWWQTETGGIMISPLAGITKTIPGFATLPLPGIQPMLVDNEGNEITGNGVEGNLCIKFPWPSIIRTTWGDHERCRQNYFSTYHNLYFTGDGCKRDEQGNYRITGRVDDVMNVSGHRIGTAEVENAINQHPDIVESAVVGYPHPIKGQGIYAYVISTNHEADNENLRSEIIAVVNKLIGPIAKPDKIQIVRGLPKTRSGKIMRRILRKVAEGETSNLGDVSTLLDPGVVDDIKAGAIS